MQVLYKLEKSFTEIEMNEMLQNYKCNEEWYYLFGHYDVWCVCVELGSETIKLPSILCVLDIGSTRHLVSRGWSGDVCVDDVVCKIRIGRSTLFVCLSFVHSSCE